MLQSMAKQLVLLAVLLLLSHRAHALPLSTRGRWVVDAASGHRVKLRCVNWVAHMPAVLPEGLDRQPLGGIAARVASLGFNCVRLTWATYLFTNESYESLTVGASLGSLGLDEAVHGVGRNNPSMLSLTVREAYDAVVGAIGNAGLMVVLDNHISRPQWCCGDNDGNGFFGDLYFDPEEWLRGLGIVASRFRGKSQVVGMSMRNELRGPKQSEPVWHKYVTRGARLIHETNPDVLVIVSGLNYDTDLSFLRTHPLESQYDGKLVFEAHWYSFNKRQQWDNDSPNHVCSNATREFDERVGFVAQSDNGSAPLFVSEFGVDQRGRNRADNHFLGCFLAFAAERDIDWALWTLQGSYYWRNGQAGFEETYGVLDANWDLPRNPQFQERFGLIQEMLQDPGSTTEPYQIIYHPQTGQCVQVDGDKNVVLGDCKNRSRWSYDGSGTAVKLLGMELCLRAVGDGVPVFVSTECNGTQNTWSSASKSEFQIAVADSEGRRLCLERSPANSSAIFPKECLCLGDSVCLENPEIQWFRFVLSNI